MEDGVEDSATKFGLGFDDDRNEAGPIRSL